MKQKFLNLRHKIFNTTSDSVSSVISPYSFPLKLSNHVTQITFGSSYEQAHENPSLLTCYFFSYSLVPLPLACPLPLTNTPHSSDYNSKELFCSNSEQHTLVPPVCRSMSLLDKARKAGDGVLVFTAFPAPTQHLADTR